MTLIAVVDPMVCSAYGKCVELAPEAFALDEVASVIGPADDDKMMAAAEACPTSAIRLLDGDTREQVFP